MTDTDRQEMLEWLRRGKAAAARYDAKRYEYDEAQPEEDGLSMASIDDEISQQAKDRGITNAEFDALMAEVWDR